MRCLLVTPSWDPPTRGNAVTARRIAAGLTALGWQVDPISPGELEAAPPPPPAHDVIHALHAYRSGVAAARWAQSQNRPLVVTLTGTDVNHDLFDPARQGILLETLESAAAVTAFHSSMPSAVSWVAPRLAARIRIVPQSVWLPDGDAHLRSGVGKDGVVLFLPGGIRPVKGNTWPFGSIRFLQARFPRIHLFLAGPVLDPVYHQQLLGELDKTPNSRWLGEFAHEHMGSALKDADLVLNCSWSEGGQANSILEAQSLGRPVLVRRIPGNLSLVEEGVTGLTFGDEIEFQRQLAAFLLDPEPAQRMAVTARQRVLDVFSSEKESALYDEIYRQLLG
jgi:glycosyltransferase involved in cell wall biosynthesis